MKGGTGTGKATSLTLDEFKNLKGSEIAELFDAKPVVFLRHDNLTYGGPIYEPKLAPPCDFPPSFQLGDKEKRPNWIIYGSSSQPENSVLQRMLFVVIDDKYVKPGDLEMSVFAEAFDLNPDAKRNYHNWGGEPNPGNLYDESVYSVKQYNLEEITIDIC